MTGMDSYSKAAMERAMKVQEVILRAMAKKITWWQAAEIIGCGSPQFRTFTESMTWETVRTACIPLRFADVCAYSLSARLDSFCLCARDELVLENLALRQPLLTFHAKRPRRPRLGDLDKLSWSSSGKYGLEGRDH